MKRIETFARLVFAAIAAVLVFLAMGLIAYAVLQLVGAVLKPDADPGRALLDAVGYTVIAVAVFEVAKFIIEEEVIDPTEMRLAGEARQMMTKFMTIIAIAVFLEALVTVFETAKADQVEKMLYPTLLLFAGVAMVVGLGVYQRLSVSVERDSDEPSQAADAHERPGEQRGGAAPDKR